MAKLDAAAPRVPCNRLLEPIAQATFAESHDEKYHQWGVPGDSSRYLRLPPDIKYRTYRFVARVIK